MRSPIKTKLLTGLLIVGTVVGFGSGFYRMAHHRHGYADALTRVCVDAALGRDSSVAEPWGHAGHRARWVAERCAAHARDAKAP
jgi:hypothetical protein